MNANTLKSFAAEARIELIVQVSRKLDFVLTHDTAELQGKQTEIAQFNHKIKQTSRELVFETVAYTWFNRFMALRFMDTNGYTLTKVFTPFPRMTNPEILQNALAIHFETDMHRQHLKDYLQPIIAKLESAKQTQTMLSIRENLSPCDKVAASKEIDNLQKMIDDCKTYERTLFTHATPKISKDLDDGVKVNYQKFKKVLMPIKRLEKKEE